MYGSLLMSLGCPKKWNSQSIEFQALTTYYLIICLLCFPGIESGCVVQVDLSNLLAQPPTAVIKGRYHPVGLLSTVDKGTIHLHTTLSHTQNTQITVPSSAANIISQMFGAREMAQWSRDCLALAENPKLRSVPCTRNRWLATTWQPFWRSKRTYT